MSADSSTQEGTYRFQVPAVLGTVQYRDLPVVPDKLNPRRLGALVSALRGKGIEYDQEEWDSWLDDVTEEWPVVFSVEDYGLKKNKNVYEIRRNFSIQVYADSNPEAREIVDQCFDTGPFTSYDIRSFQSDGEWGQKVAEAFDQVTEKNDMADGGGYESEYPEILMGNLGRSGVEEGKTVGIIRLDVGHERITKLIERGREYLQDPEMGSEDFQLRIRIQDREVSDRIVSAAERMLTEGEVMEKVTLAEDEPVVSLVIGMGENDVHRLLKFVDTVPDPIYDEMGMTYWPHDFSEYTTDILVETAEKALEIDEPGVVNPKKKQETEAESIGTETEQNQENSQPDDRETQPFTEPNHYRISVELNAADTVYEELDANYVDDLPVNSLGQSDDGLVIVEPELALFVDVAVDPGAIEKLRDILGTIDVTEKKAKINVLKSPPAPGFEENHLFVEVSPEFNVPKLRDEIRQAVGDVGGTIETENIPTIARYKTVEPYFIGHDVPLSMTPDRDLEDHERKRVEAKEEFTEHEADLQTTVGLKRVKLTELDQTPRMAEL